MSIKNLSKKTFNLSRLALLVSLGATGCKTVTINGDEVICKTPYSSYLKSHPCYEEPSRSSGSSSGSSSDKEPHFRDKDYGGRDRDSKGGHYEGCPKR